MDLSKTDQEPTQPAPTSLPHPILDLLERHLSTGPKGAVPLDAERPRTLSYQPYLLGTEVASPLPPLQDETAVTPFDESNFNDPSFLSAAATEIYRMRRARDHVLPSELTGEPAWDMLLALYSEEPIRMTVSSLCHGSGVPHSTALRWISMLEQKGLIKRAEHTRDEKVILLSLAPQGRRLVEQALKAMLRAFRGP